MGHLLIGQGGYTRCRGRVGSENTFSWVGVGGETGYIGQEEPNPLIVTAWGEGKR